MATAQIATVSNDPQLDEDRIDELEEHLDEYVYGTGPHDEVTVEIENQPSFDAVYLTIRGYADFAPVVRKDRFEEINEEGDRDFYSDTRYSEDDTVEFLQRLSEYLESELVVQTVSHTKLRFPVGASMWRVDPDGTVSRCWFDGTNGEVRTQEYGPESEGGDAEVEEWVRVTFYPQIWRNDNAVTSDDKETFYVPREDATDEEGDLFPDNDWASDRLRRHENAPERAKKWQGPFYVTLEEIGTQPPTEVTTPNQGDA